MRPFSVCVFFALVILLCVTYTEPWAATILEHERIKHWIVYNDDGLTESICGK